MTTDAVAIVALDGDAYTRGVQLGHARRAQIKAFVEDGLARLDCFLPTAPSLSDVTDRLRRFAASIRRQTPDLWREIEGLAEGAGIGVDVAVLLQVRRELAGYTRFETRGDCTTFCRVAQPAMLAQTIDLAADMQDQLCLMKIHDTLSGRRSMVVSFTGLLGYLGLNYRGVAIGLNLVLGGPWNDELPPYLAIRHLIDVADTTEDAIARLLELDLASSRAIMICDGSSAACVEYLAGTFRVLRGSQMAHTNHFLADDLVARDEMHVFARNGSLARLKACQSWLSDRQSGFDPQDVFELFSRPPALMPASDDRRRETTAASIAVDLAARAIHLRRGDPRCGATSTFTFETNDRLSQDTTHAVTAP